MSYVKHPIIWDPLKICEEDDYEEDKMHPGFKENYLDFDAKNGFKTFSTFQFYDDVQSEEEAEVEKREREKNIIKMEKNRDIIRIVKDRKMRSEVGKIVGYQNNLLELSKYIRDYKKFHNRSEKENTERYNLYLKFFCSKWKQICDKIKNSQNKTVFFKNVNSLWDKKDVRIIRSREGMKKKAIYKCSKCSRWEDVAFAFMRESSRYSPPICLTCSAFDIYDKKKGNKK